MKASAILKSPLSLILFLSFMQGHLLLLQLSLPFKISINSERLNVIGLGVLLLAMSYAGRAIGIYFAGTLQKRAHFAALFGAFISFILFNLGNTLAYFLGAISFGLSVSAANIFTRSNLLSLSEDKRPRYFFYILILSILGMWVTLLEPFWILGELFILAIAISFKIKVTLPNHQNSQHLPNLWLLSKEFVGKEKIFILRTAILILMVTIFNASIFSKLGAVFQDRHQILLVGLSLISGGVVLFGFLSSSSLKRFLPSAHAIELLYILSVTAFFLTGSGYFSLLGIPLCYCLSQFSFLDLLKTSEELKCFNYPLLYEVVGFFVGLIFSVLSYSSQFALQMVLCGLVLVYFILLFVDRVFKRKVAL